MRPAGIHGEVRRALFDAACTLRTPDRGPTLQELAGAAQVGLGAAMSTVKNMTRCGQLKVARTRKVEHRNRPVAEYEPATAGTDEDVDEGATTGYVDLGNLLTVWNR